MKERFIKSKGEGFSQHELMEMLLFYSIPRANTNETAHHLLEQFGSLKRLFQEGSFLDFMHVPGIGYESARYLELLCKVIRCVEVPQVENTVLESYEKCREYFLAQLGAETRKEVVMAVALSDTMGLHNAEILDTGTPGTVPLNLEKVVRFIVRSDCNVLLLAHNHPRGQALPSVQDVLATKSLVEYINKIHVELFDHIIVAEGKTYSMAEHGDF